MLKYKGYTGYVVYDDEARIFHGEVAAIKAVITFQGTTVDEIEQAFKDSIDDYLDWCKIAKLMNEGSHLTVEGLNLIREIKSGINTGRDITNI